MPRVLTIGGSAVPRLAPSTSASATGTDTMPAAEREITSSTMARLEWAIQVMIAPISSASTGSPSSDPSRVCTISPERIGPEASTISFSASSI